MSECKTFAGYLFNLRLEGMPEQLCYLSYFCSSRQMQDEDVLLKYVQCCWLICFGHFHTFSRFLRWLVGEFLMHLHKKCIHFLLKRIKSALKVHIEFIRKFVKYVKNLLKTIKHITYFTSSNTRLFK